MYVFHYLIIIIWLLHNLKIFTCNVSYIRPFNFVLDIDECLLKTTSCSKTEGMTCMNIVGGYMCVCKLGYKYITIQNTDSGYCSKIVTYEIKDKSNIFGIF